MCVRVNRDYRTKNLDSRGYSDKNLSALDLIISCARLLRTPDSMRTGGALLGALKIIFACMSSISEGSDFWTRTETTQNEGKEASLGRDVPSLIPSYFTFPFLILPGHVGQDGRPDQASRWLWVVRLCFDRRSSVRTLSIRILGVVLRNTHSLLVATDCVKRARESDLEETEG